MTLERLLHIIVTTIICLVWFVNGLFCKVLNLVPRHREIVARIVGDQYSRVLTTMIGIAVFFVFHNVGGTGSSNLIRK